MNALKRKYSSSGPTLKVSKPICAIRSSARRSTCRGSPSYGSPSGLTTSQIIRPTTGSPGPEGSSRKVAGSGIATMSDSSIALKPVIDEPSKPIPSSSASSISLGVIAKLFRCPSMSVNQRSANSTPSSSIRRKTARRASSLDVARFLLSTCAMEPPLERKKASGASGTPEASSPRDDRGILHRDRARHVNPLEARPVAELLVHAPHRRIREVVLRPQGLDAHVASARDLSALQSRRDAAAAPVAANAGHPVPHLARVVTAEDCVADHVLSLERGERELADGERPEIPPPPVRERCGLGRPGRRDVGLRLLRHRVHARFELLAVAQRDDLDPGRSVRHQVDVRGGKRDVLHSPHLGESVSRVERDQVNGLCPRDGVHLHTAEPLRVPSDPLEELRADPPSPERLQHANTDSRGRARRVAVLPLDERPTGSFAVEHGEHAETAGRRPLAVEA